MSSALRGVLAFVERKRTKVARLSSRIRWWRYGSSGGRNPRHLGSENDEERAIDAA